METPIYRFVPVDRRKRRPSGPPRLARQGFRSAKRERVSVCHMLRPKACWDGRLAQDPHLPQDYVEQLLAHDLGSAERRALRAICETADIRHVGRRRFLVAPIGSEIEQVLSMFEAEREDIEPVDGADGEHDHAEDNGDEEPDTDDL